MVLRILWIILKYFLYFLAFAFTSLGFLHFLHLMSLLPKSFYLYCDVDIDISESVSKLNELKAEAVRLNEQLSELRNSTEYTSDLRVKRDSLHQKLMENSIKTVRLEGRIKNLIELREQFKSPEFKKATVRVEDVPNQALKRRLSDMEFEESDNEL